AVSDNHVNSGTFRELPYLDFLDHTVMGDELKAQVRRGVASAALAYRAPLDDFDLLVEAFEHAQAQSYEGIGFDRLALAIEQECVTFDLGEFEFALATREDGFEQLVDNV